jgi:hypothetical protein
VTRALLVLVLVVALSGVGARRAAACPDCETALVTRARFVTEDFMERLLISMAPFVVIIGAVIAIERAVDRRRT